MSNVPLECELFLAVWVHRSLQLVGDHLLFSFSLSLLLLPGVFCFFSIYTSKVSVFCLCDCLLCCAHYSTIVYLQSEIYMYISRFFLKPNQPLIMYMILYFFKSCFYVRYIVLQLFTVHKLEFVSVVHICKKYDKS